MQSIEINTAQNVRIEYELAGLGQRIFAYIIDFIIMMLVMIAFASSLFAYEDSIDSFKTITLVIEVFAFVWLGFYTLISEVLGNGQTLGKKAMGIKVIKTNGEELQFYDYFSRWSMRLLDIYLSLGTVAMMLIVSNRNGQRLGDIIAGTSIIRKRSSYGFSLNDILKLNTRRREDFDFEFPLVTRLEEKDVILIKNLVYRKRLYNNEAHESAMDRMIEKLSVILELKSAPSDKEAFLNKLISEYIILTR